MPKVPYLNRSSSGTFYFLRRYPTELCKMVGKKYEKTNLGTRERVVAEQACRRMAVAFDEEMAALRRKLPRASAESSAETTSTHLTPDEIPVIARRAAAAYLYSDDDDRQGELDDANFEAYKSEVREHHEQLSRDLARGRLSGYLDEVVDILGQDGLTISETSPLVMTLVRSVVASFAQASAEVLQRLEGKVIETPPAPPPPRSERDLDDLNRAFDHWLDKQKPTEKTVMETRATLKRFMACTGRTRITAITVDDVLTFQQHERATRTTVRPQTINKALDLLSAVVQLACTDKLRCVNPFQGVRSLKVRAGERQTRQGYTPQQRERLFAGPVHAERVRPDGGAGEAAFWLPVLGYATGARLDELGQLTLADISDDGTGHVLSIQAGVVDEAPKAAGAESRVTVKSVKTDTSVRLVPVHSAVMALGFADYVAWLRSRGETWLFPKLTPDHYGHRTGLWSRWFNRYLDRSPLNLDIDGLDFHSFRHLFKTLAREARMNLDVVDALQGHASSRASQDYGSFSLSTLRWEIEQLALPALRAPHLKWTPPSGNERTRLKVRNAPRRR